MDCKQNKHYVNKHDQQLKDFMIEKFGLEQYRIWCKLNAFKYQARAGKKEGNSEDKDLKKRDDYIKEVFGSEMMQYMLMAYLKSFAAEFEEWEGK